MHVRGRRRHTVGVRIDHSAHRFRQCEQAQNDINTCGQALSGQVSVGLAPGTAASALSVPLLRAVRERHPGIVLYLNENYGITLSELIMNGRMDMAVLYGGREVHGLSFVSLLREPISAAFGKHLWLRRTSRSRAAGMQRRGRTSPSSTSIS